MAQWMERTIEHGTFPALAAGSVLAAAWGGRAGVSPPLVLAAILFVGALLLLGLQRLHPAVPAWCRWRPHAAIDVAHTWISSLGAALVTRALVFGGVLQLAHELGERGLQPWPGDWPLWLQLPLALLVSDLGAYAIHRASHRWDPLWRLHALHHSSEQLYVLSSGRNHPLHTAITTIVESVPLLVLGAGEELLLVHAALAGTVGLLQHANVRLRHGAWSYVFATADLHRWHHSAEEAESHTNFGNTIVVWDHVFQSFYLPRRAPAAVGIGGTHFPRHLLWQLWSPFVLRRFEDQPAENHTEN